MDFIALKDFVRIVNKNKIKQIEVLGNDIGLKTNVSEMYEGLCQGKWKTEDEIAKHFFNTSSKDSRYQKLSDHLVRQLVNTTFFIDSKSPQYKDKSTAKANCYRNFAAASILLDSDGGLVGTKILQTTLEHAQKFEFIDLCADITKKLRRHYLIHTDDRIIYNKYTDLSKMFEFKRTWEGIAFDYFHDLQFYFKNNHRPDESIHSKATLYYEELYPMMEQVDTAIFIAHTYLIGIMKHFSNNDIKGCLQLIDEALPILLIRENTGRGHILAILIQKLACEIQNKTTDNIFSPDSTANRCLEYADDSSFNWFKVKSLQFYQYLHTRHYPEAYEIYNGATKNERFHLLKGVNREDWDLFTIYLQLLGSLGKLDQETVAVIGAFKKSKYDNQFQNISKEKNGLNIPVILMPILHDIVENSEYGKTREALIQYKKRYLEESINRRSIIFIDILMRIMDLPYKPENKKKIDSLILELKNEPSDYIGQSFAIEIIPYEDLTAMLLQVVAPPPESSLNVAIIENKASLC
jgi:hypothetical protein